MTSADVAYLRHLWKIT